jgi:transglutaminase-like putative cysteine protease
VLIRIGYDIVFEVPITVPIVALLNVHPSRRHDLRGPDEVQIEPQTPTSCYQDNFGNLSCRFVAPAGEVRLRNSTLIYDSGMPDAVSPEAREAPVENLPNEVLQFLLNSRYCEVDRMLNIAADLFANAPRGWGRVQAVCDWVHD